MFPINLFSRRYADYPSCERCQVQCDKMNSYSMLGALPAILLTCGCANQGTSQPGRRDASRPADGIKAYKLTITQRNFGTTIVEVQHSYIATLVIDLNNKNILWKQNYGDGEERRALKLVRIDGEEAVFSNSGSVVEITGSGRDGDVVIVSRGLEVWDVDHTPRGSAQEFYSDLSKLGFPQNFHGLVATTKYIDGHPTPIRYEFVGSLQILDSACLLNDKTASLRRSRLPNGAGVITISDGNEDLVVWPDGEWLLSDAKDSGVQFRGVDQSLSKAYLSLRRRAQEVPSSGPSASGSVVGARP